MYHETFLTQPPKNKVPAPEIHTGYYRFFFKGGIITGNLKRIGAETVTIDCPLMGKIEMRTIEFLDSCFEKI